MNLRRALLGLGALAMAVPGDAAGAVAPRLPALDAELSAIVADPERPLASLAVLAIRAGEVAYVGQFGRRRIAGAGGAKDEAVTPSTLFRIASISKLVTALGAMRLVEEGKLALDADVGQYLGWRLRNPRHPDVAITLRMLLSHTSTLRDDAGYHWPAGVALRDALEKAGDTPWSNDARPGAWFTYANLNSGVVATAMERVTGERFDRLMGRLVLEPLGMRGGFEPAEFSSARLSELATLYRKRAPDDDAQWNPKGAWIAQVDDYSTAAPVHRAAAGYRVGTNGSLFGPQGNLRASVEDLGRMLRMLAGGGVIDGVRFLKRESVELMLAEQWRFDGSNGVCDYEAQPGLFLSWGLGVQRFVDRGGRNFGDRLVEGGGFRGAGHLGDAYGLTGVFALDPASRNGMIVLVGGTGFDPATDPGTYSALHRYEERILTAIDRHALPAVR